MDVRFVRKADIGTERSERMLSAQNPPSPLHLPSPHLFPQPGHLLGLNPRPGRRRVTVRQPAGVAHSGRSPSCRPCPRLK